ncbi:MAG: oligosaccharide flippase family protein [Chloroflexi bacterium]|nr:oligosaccharide flippase family protein [Chloroflexota bacterium]
MQSIQGLVRQLKNSPDTQLALLRGTGLVFVLQVVGSGLLYLLNLIYERWFGTIAFGQFIFLLSWLQIFGAISELGFSQSSLRFLPTYEENSQHSLTRGFLVWSAVVVTLTGTIIGLIAAGVFSIAPQLNDYRNLAPAFMFTPVFALQFLVLNISRGFGNVVLAFFPELILKPIFGILSAIVLLRFSGIPDRMLGISAYTVGVGMVMLIFVVQIITYFRDKLQVRKNIYQPKTWLMYSFPLMGMRVNQVFFQRISTIIIGFMINPSAIAIYAVSERISSFAVFFQRAAVFVFAPLIAPLHEKGDNETLNKYISMIADWSFFSSVGVSVVLVIFSPFLLGMFGEEYLEGQFVLIVLLLAQITHGFTGPAPLTLDLTGHQGLNFKIHVGGTILAVVLHVMLIPLWGIEGAAIALVLASVAQNWLAYYYLKKRLGLNSLPTFTQVLQRRAESD